MFHLFFSEVLKALHNTRELYERWRAVDEGRDIRSIEEQEWAATELRNALRYKECMILINRMSENRIWTLIINAGNVF